MHNEDSGRYYGEPRLYEGNKAEGGFLDMTFFCCLVAIYCFCMDNHKMREMNGILYGAVYLINAIAVGHLTGGCINIVELIGPSFFALNFRHWGYYILP